MVASPSANSGNAKSSSQSAATDKSAIRAKIWPQLRKVALPDSRFHHDYSSFIADFAGSSHAITLLASLPCYKSAPVLFIAPDNCLQELRFRALQDGKTVLVTTYGIRRGFWLLDPSAIERRKWEVAALLDGMEIYGRHVSLSEIRALYQHQHIPLMVTGTGAISSVNGLRFGKGHGFFDLEWAILSEIGVVSKETITVAVVHECQLVEEVLVGEEWDTGCDFVVTNERVVEIEVAAKPTCGVVWDRLEKGMLEDIEPLGEWQALLSL